jgi:hypothetical protein
MADKIGNPLEEAAQSGVLGRKQTFTPGQQDSTAARSQATTEREQNRVRVKRTLMFTPARAKWLKVQAAQEGREMSDIVDEALATYQQLHSER